MQDILDQPLGKIVDYVRGRFRKYEPHTIRRTYIPKDNGKKLRALGIPTMEERLLQQCIFQVLEPVAEAKFVHQSFGFRPHRSVHHALARVHCILCSTTCEFAVDMDIRSFFDNVSHSKLIKQLWTIGIHDKALLTIIKRMLKAGVVEIKFPEWEKELTIPEKGTPAGGILSPLLANIVLNELDHWIVSQWEEFETDRKYADKSGKLRSLKKSRLKRMYYVRYADDYRIFTDTYESARKIYKAVEQWLKDRLKLEVNPDKSQIVRLKRTNMKFLGITFKLAENPKAKSHKVKNPSLEWIPHTSVMPETCQKMRVEIKNRIIGIQKTFKHEERIKAILNYNAYVRGLQFYAVTSKWYKVSSKLRWNTKKTLYNRLKGVSKTLKVSRSGEVEVGKFEKKRN